MSLGEPDGKLIIRPALPWATISIALLAVLAWKVHAMSESLIYGRAPILEGQIWRLWTGHAVHFGGSHLFWNLAVFLPTGCWLERLWPTSARWFYGICPVVISLVLLGLDPSLLRYAGLSGLAVGMLVLLAGLQLRRVPGEPAWFWLGVLALVGGKIAYELITGAALLVDSLEIAGVRNVPLAHLSGAGCAAVFWLASVLRDRAKPAVAANDGGS